MAYIQEIHTQTNIFKKEQNINEILEELKQLRQETSQLRRERQQLMQKIKEERTRQESQEEKTYEEFYGFLKTLRSMLYGVLVIIVKTGLETLVYSF